MKLINSFNIETSAMPSSAVTRSYQINGDPGALFTLIVQNDDSDFYNFPENTIVSVEEGISRPDASFSSTPTQLLQKEIGENGEYSGFITFPVISSDDYYIITLIAGDNTEINSELSSTKKIYISDKIYKYKDTTVTFSLLHSSSAVVEPSNYTKSGLSSTIERKSFTSPLTIDWSFTLSSDSCVIARQPVISDFEFTTTKTTITAGSSATELELDSIEGLSVGMVAVATGIPSNTVISKIVKGYKNTGKSTAATPVYDIPVTTDADGVLIESKAGTVTLDKASTFVVDRVVTFTGKGSKHSEAFNNTRFKIKNFTLTIDPVVTTTDAAASSTTTIPLTSTNGIKAAETVIMSGIGVSGTPHVDTVNDGVSVVVSAAQTIENGQTLTFTGSSRAGKITANLEVLEYGNDDITLTLNLDNILTVA
tara:strand:+ start:2725 stop:3996 length:1272 start_codon:yes stop_codon:yes gene_type:complete